jgi:hypothetical protein
MKLRCSMLGDGVFTATLVETPSMMSRGATEIVLEIAAGAPVQVGPPDGLGAVVVEATDDEWARLRAAGYELPRG